MCVCVCICVCVIIIVVSMAEAVNTSSDLLAVTGDGSELPPSLTPQGLTGTTKGEGGQVPLALSHVCLKATQAPACSQKDNLGFIGTTEVFTGTIQGS